ncbi:MAG: hypothetical protein H0X33_08615 [Taibaiella sp.]|nr:hypothetical protein [Taibaiella sp.]
MTFDEAMDKIMDVKKVILNMELYISSDDFTEFFIPRKVLSYYKTKIETRNVLVIQVDRGVIGQKFGLRDYDPDIFYLVNRVDVTLFEHLNRFPIDVHVLIIKKLTTNPIISFDQLQNIVWACLYDNEVDAINHRRV